MEKIHQRARILVVMGTRPEAIKLAPVIAAFSGDPLFETTVCISSQHVELLQQVTDFFGIRPDYNLSVMQPNQTLTTVTTRVVLALEPVFSAVKPDLVVVQGDTTTTFSAALAAYYHQIPVAHVEAGLRTHDFLQPFPEEMNRRLVGQLALWHFPPTSKADENLSKENPFGRRFVVGNTGIDALFQTVDLLKARDGEYEAFFKTQLVNTDRRIVLITAHRRESFGDPFLQICQAIRALAAHYSDVEFVFPVHPNPQVREVSAHQLTGIKNVHLMTPLPYPHLVWLMQRCAVILTDSGGIQEEAPSLQKPVLVMRDVTERTEAVEAGGVAVIGTSTARIVSSVSGILDGSMTLVQRGENPYGNGTAARQILSILKEYWTKKGSFWL